MGKNNETLKNMKKWKNMKNEKNEQNGEWFRGGPSMERNEEFQWRSVNTSYWPVLQRRERDQCFFFAFDSEEEGLNFKRFGG